MEHTWFTKKYAHCIYLTNKLPNSSFKFIIVIFFFKGKQYAKTDEISMPNYNVKQKGSQKSQTFPGLEIFR